MYGRITVTGMVISSMPIGEVDRRVIILTKEKGKVSAFAKGCRRPTSTLLGCSQMFTFGQFVLYEGKDSYNLEGADIQTSFPDLVEDMEALSYGVYFSEYAQYLTRENVEAKKEINLLYAALRALEKKQVNKRLIRIIYEFRFLTEGGEMPEVHRCLKCGREMINEEHSLFHAKEGGLICMNCSGGMSGVTLSRSAVYTLQFIVTSPVSNLFSFNVSDEVLAELERARNLYSKIYAGFKFKTEEMLNLFSET